MNARKQFALKDIRVMFAVGTVVGRSDDQLLERFLTHRDEAAEFAFAAIVERHGPMVLRVCRSVLADPHDADDAFQATFIVLARKAGSIRTRASLASFLHGVALRAARDVRTASIRRKRHEGLAAERPSPPENCREIVQALHEEVARLPERFRAPIVLCELEGLSCDEAAHRLGCPVGTIKSRLSRGRGRLRTGLSRRGLASLVSFGAAITVPEALAETTARAARSFATGTASATVAEGILRAMIAAKIKGAVASLLVVGAALTIGAAWFQVEAPVVTPPTPFTGAILSPPPVASAVAQAPIEDKDDLPGEMNGPSRDEIVALIKKIGREKATPELVDQITSSFRPRVTFTGDLVGLTHRVIDPSLVADIDALARELTGKPADTKTLISQTWSQQTGRQLELQRVHMREALVRRAEPPKTLRGRVVDEDEKPIAGVEVTTSGALTHTDAIGDFTLTFPRPRFAFARIYLEANGYGLSETILFLDEIKATDNREYRLSKQAACDGRVVDPDGKPVAGAELDLWLAREVVVRDGSMDKDPNSGTAEILKSRTDNQGRFAFRGLPPKPLLIVPNGPKPRYAFSLKATHRKFEPNQHNFTPDEGPSSDMEFILQPGCTISGTVVDEAGQPVVGATVLMIPPEKMNYRPVTTTDATGRFRFDDLTPGLWQISVQPERLAMAVAKAMASREVPIDLKNDRLGGRLPLRQGDRPRR